MDESKSIIAITKRCRVCGDQASCFHYNGLSCAACKTFFRRSAFKYLKCENESDCEVNRVTRSNCMKCRFDKCLAIGMKKVLVSRLPKKISQSKPISTILAPIDRMHRLLSNERTLNLKMGELSRLEELYRAVLAFPNESSWQIVGQLDSVSQSVNLAAVNIKYIVRFCKKLAAFNWLSKDEQVIALKCFAPEINQIRVAFIYDTETNCWAALEHSDCDKTAIFVKMDLFKSLSNVEKYNLFSNSIIDLHQEMENDPAIRDLILVQSVFKPRPTMDNHEFVRYHNAVFHYLLLRYFEHKYLDTNRAAQKYTSMMELLAKMDIAINAVREFYSSPHITTHVAPVLREIYNLGKP